VHGRFIIRIRRRSSGSTFTCGTGITDKIILRVKNEAGRIHPDIFLGGQIGRIKRRVAWLGSTVTDTLTL
jgi:hypothetical protein